MAKATLKYDFRCPDFCGQKPETLYRVALEQSEWADKKGFSQIQISEHHGSSDGYIPSPITMLSAIAARTTRIRLQVCVLVIPYHDPIRIAEDLLC